MQTGTDDSGISKQERVLRKIKALLALAERETTPGPERESARNQAERLILRHSIDEALLQDKSSDPSVPVSEVIAFFPQYWKEHVTLMYNIYRVFRCEVIVLQSGHRRDEAKVDTVGFPQDLALAWTLFQSIDQQMTVEMFADAGSVAYRKSFAAGFTNIVIRRLKQHYAEVLQDAEIGDAETGVAMVLYNRAQLVKSAFDDRYPDRQKIAQSRAASSDIIGAFDGAEAGRRADILLDDHKVGATSVVGQIEG